ncbi:MAG: hypothetical protein RJA98_925 [Pseudomonadota bacterium]
MQQPPQPTLRQDARTIGLIGLAHGSSHFFHLLLPPLFPLFIAEFGLSYSQLGLLITLFFVISGTGQALSGFVVDKVGARPVLFAALCSFVLAAVATASARSYDGLLVAAALAGLGNAPFHPADFTILNKRVSPQRLGHAFSVHGISGNLGWAAAPLFLTGLTQALGSWRLAALAAGAWALAVLLILVWNRDALDDRAGAAEVLPGAARVGAQPAEHPMAFLKLPSVWMCFSFFFWTTCALSAIQGFAGPALHTLYGLKLELTAFIVTGFMLCGAVGMVIGGFWVGRAERLEKLIAGCLLAASAALALVGSGWLPGWLAFGVAAAAGFGVGLAGPSRDLLIKRAAPPGATGRVYGTVYSGLDVGFAVAAPVFGALMDAQRPGAVFLGSALALLAGVASATLVGAQVARRKRAVAAA